MSAFPSKCETPSQHERLRRVRVIPTLLIDSRGGLIKTKRFQKRKYIGDPINAVKIFNTKEVDELILLDIDATTNQWEPNYSLIEDIVGEAFMPVGYGGGIRTMDQISQLYKCGIEKVVISSALAVDGDLIEQASRRFGAQAVVACLQVKRSFFGGYQVKTHSGRRYGGGKPAELARKLVERGVGEIIVYDIDRDGTYAGYNLDLIRTVTAAVGVPVVACGGAARLEDFRAAITEAGSSAVAAGSIFVYQAKDRGVLISYPDQSQLIENVFTKVVQ